MKRYFYFLILCLSVATVCCAQTATENYVITETMLDASGKNKITSVQYYDGLGRPSLAVQNGINNSSSVSNYTLQEYDGSGRVSKSWLPIANSGLDYNANITSSALDSKAYSQTKYDALDRPVFVSTPGSDMNDKGKTIEYTTNVANSVKRYTISGTTTISQNGYYPACSLTGEKTTDEDGHSIEVFKDLPGNVILERRYEDKAKYNDTYYVYNDILQLCYVLPPMCTSVSTTMLDNYAYQYTYDAKGRMATKKLPGCNACEYRYDTADRLIASKDGNGIIRFYLYDGLGRQVVQGRCMTLQTNDMPYANASLTTGSGIGGSGYTVSGYKLLDAVLEIANYYDDYSFLNVSPVISAIGKYGFPATGDACATSFLTGQIQCTSDGNYLYSANYYDIRGNLTKRYETMPEGVMMKTETTYSFTDQPTKTVTTLTKNGVPYVLTEDNNYDNNCDKLSRTTVTYNGTSEETAYIYYDKYGRLSCKKTCDRYYTTDYWYNMRNSLTYIDAHDAYYDNIFYEKLYYADVQDSDSDTPCFNGDISSFVWKSTYDNVYRKYNFEYDGLDRLLNASYSEGKTVTGMTQNDKYKESIQYNANSSPTLISRFGKKNTGIYQAIDNLNYVYNGNRLQRITDSAGSLIYSYSFDFKDKTNATTEYMYDNNGNMTRDLNSKIGLMQYDELNYPKRIQFMDGSNIQYVYAADGRKLKVTHQTAVNNISVAAGNKLELTPSTLKSQTVKNYYGQFQFCNNKPDRVMFDGGYISFEYGEESSIFHYYFTDHLGSIRVSADNTYAPDQVNHYYPYGGLIGDLSYEEGFQNYKYNGKEMDRMYGLDWLDYGARMYNPATTLWTQMDPLCEKYYNVSPYVYCAGNPVNRIDPDGRDWYSSLDSVEYENDQSIWQTQIHYTEYTSQEQMNENGIDGTYLGETAVLFDGFYDEKLGTDNTLDGPDSKHATATVYGAEGPDDITQYTAFTMTSNFEKYGAIRDGYYDVSWRADKGRGSIPKHYRLEKGGAINTIDGNRYEGGYSKYQKDGIFIHRTNMNGTAGDGLRPVSLGCLLIKAQQWKSFENHVGRNPYKIILRRKCGK